MKRVKKNGEAHGSLKPLINELMAVQTKTALTTITLNHPSIQLYLWANLKKREQPTQRFGMEKKIHMVLLLILQQWLLNRPLFDSFLKTVSTVQHLNYKELSQQEVR